MAGRLALCAYPELLVKIAAAEDWPTMPTPEQCPDGATRRVVLVLVWPGGGVSTLGADVCLWHALVARERHDARIVPQSVLVST